MLRLAALIGSPAHRAVLPGPFGSAYAPRTLPRPALRRGAGVTPPGPSGLRGLPRLRPAGRPCGGAGPAARFSFRAAAAGCGPRARGSVLRQGGKPRLRRLRPCLGSAAPLRPLQPGPPPARAVCGPCGPWPSGPPAWGGWGAALRRAAPVVQPPPPGGRGKERARQAALARPRALPGLAGLPSVAWHSLGTGQVFAASAPRLLPIGPRLPRLLWLPRPRCPPAAAGPRSWAAWAVPAWGRFARPALRAWPRVCP